LILIKTWSFTNKNNLSVRITFSRDSIGGSFVKKALLALNYFLSNGLKGV